MLALVISVLGLVEPISPEVLKINFVILDAGQSFPVTVTAICKIGYNVEGQGVIPAPEYCVTALEAYAIAVAVTTFTDVVAAVLTHPPIVAVTEQVPSLAAV